MISQLQQLHAWIDTTNGYILAGSVLALIGSMIAVFCYLPGIIKVIKTHDTRGISALMFGFTTFGCFVWVIVGILNIVGLTKSKNLATGLSVGVPVLISNLGLGLCSIGIFIFKMKHIIAAKKNNMSLDDYVAKVVIERAQKIKTKNSSKDSTTTPYVE